jgi:hypothetical protein
MFRITYGQGDLLAAGSLDALVLAVVARPSRPIPVALLPARPAGGALHLFCPLLVTAWSWLR